MAITRNSINVMNAEEKAVNSEENSTQLQERVLETSLPTWLDSSLSLSHKSYHELADTPVKEVDVLTQLNDNIAVLNDLQNRYSFLMREIRYLLKV